MVVTCVVPPPPSGTGNVNIEEAEKLLKPYLKRYPKVSSTPARHPCPRVLHGPTQTHTCVFAGRHLPVLCRAD